MRVVQRLSFLVAALILSQAAFSQTTRIKYNNQQLFLSGANLAWLSFARDIGPGTTDFNSFGDILLQMHDAGGNALRWWLHTNGTSTPAFNDTGLVIGPGAGTIEDLKKALDIAWEREIGLKLCLWSFDMLRSSNSATVLNRNKLLLNDPSYTRAYIKNCLIPMIDSLKGHPAIIAWEIFNEPEGMSNEFGWSDIQHVPMAAIQRFINLCAGAIHRRDSSALVTNGAWSFKALTDVPTAALSQSGPELSQAAIAEKQQLKTRFNEKYRSTLEADEIVQYLRRIADVANYNYYTDSRLIAAGGDVRGTLDFYSVHYYDWAGTPLSPFHHPATGWGLDKPLVVAEFAMKDTYGVLKQDLFKTIFQTGYAGALAWSWTDIAFSSHVDMLAAMQYMWDNYRQAVDVNGIGGDWPTVTITSPKNDSAFAAGSQIRIDAIASDRDGTVVLVEFFANDALKIGERNSSPYSITWMNVAPGVYKLTAVATDNQGHKRTSTAVQIKVGTPAMTRIEAEAAVREGDLANVFVRSDPAASRGAYLDIRTNDPNTKITWTVPAVPAAGTYEIAFGYNLAYATPKGQFVNVNGVRVAEVMFDSVMNKWLEKKLTVPLVQGSNTIQMGLSWGWMYLDYLAVPSSILSSIEVASGEVPGSFALKQNYPNPFNPSTTIEFQLPAAGHVTLRVFDVLGREAATLVNEVRPEGTFTVHWNPSALPSGVYLYRLESESFTQTKRMLLLK